MKRLIYLIGIIGMLLIAGIASGASGDDNTGLRPVTYGNFSNPATPPPFGNVPGEVMDDKIYASLAPCYSEKMINTYGPVPVFTSDHQIVSRGILTDHTIADRNALYTKLDNLYESTKDTFNRKYAYPNGPVISYGYNALGSVTVGIYEKSTVDPETLDEMYSVIAAESKKQGIDNVPVVFYSEPIPQLNLGRTDMWRPVIGGVQTGTPAGGSYCRFCCDSWWADRFCNDRPRRRCRYNRLSAEPFLSHRDNNHFVGRDILRFCMGQL